MSLSKVFLEKEKKKPVQNLFSLCDFINMVLVFDMHWKYIHKNYQIVALVFLKYQMILTFSYYTEPAMGAVNVMEVVPSHPQKSHQPPNVLSQRPGPVSEASLFRGVQGASLASGHGGKFPSSFSS